MLEAALARIVADGTYECSSDDPQAEQVSREEIAASAWGLACEKTNENFPMLPTHLKVVRFLL